ncbi:hypothetical protein MJO28_012538 [Puccinia striiformis f. sp. tritici]|uniref:Uncharacterized protein n=1 Tax=Puccinia striiformis f. sp. tritici TaxID=168172 RepID=A0ACC0E1J0_9BASI|nr:hypothetical protein MJO28_012538 [Puccinia striiformis f. sp. tritici]KAI7945509.1 hypothetical protein MJO29_011897 [Puccinia striiformis f. sp. tritici]
MYCQGSVEIAWDATVTPRNRWADQSAAALRGLISSLESPITPHFPHRHAPHSVRSTADAVPSMPVT